MKKLVLFDCDQTLRTSIDADYISSVDSTFKKISQIEIKRMVDGKIFTLKEWVGEFILHLKKNWYAVWIISDNNYEAVSKALSAFNIIQLIDPQYIAVKSWKWYCPKHHMIAQMLWNEIDKYQISWFDDKHYEEEADMIGAKFYLINTETNYADYIKLFSPTA